MNAGASPRSRPDGCLAAFQSELDYIFASLRRLGVAPADREDVAQEIFLALRASWSKFDRERRLRPYLFAITFRISAAYRRKHGRQVPADLSDLLDWSPSPEDLLESVEVARILQAALRAVPLSRRAVLIMHHLDEVPVAELARSLSIPLFTAYSRLRKAHRELEQALVRLLPEAGVKSDPSRWSACAV